MAEISYRDSVTRFSFQPPFFYILCSIWPRMNRLKQFRGLFIVMKIFDAKVKRTRWRCSRWSARTSWQLTTRTRCWHSQWVHAHRVSVHSCWQYADTEYSYSQKLQSMTLPTQMYDTYFVNIFGKILKVLNCFIVCSYRAQAELFVPSLWWHCPFKFCL